MHLIILMKKKKKRKMPIDVYSCKPYSYTKSKKARTPFGRLAYTKNKGYTKDKIT